MKVEKLNENFTIHPQTHKRTLIWLHGFSCAGDFHLEELLSSPILPDCKVILPSAEFRTIPSMNNELYRAWYTRLGFRYHDSIEPSVSRVLSLIEDESKLTDDLYIGGFSQGGVLALMCGLSRSVNKVKAVLAFSAYAFPMNVPNENRNIPVLVYHGLKDLIIPWDKACVSYANNLVGIKYEVQIENECAHEITNQGFLFAKNWLCLKGFGNS